MGNGKGKANTISEKTNTDKKEENRRTQTVKEIGKREKVTRKKEGGKGREIPKGDYQKNGEKEDSQGWVLDLERGQRDQTGDRMATQRRPL